MHLSKGRVQLLTAEHKLQVNALRLKEYQKARGFQVTPTGIEWNRSDDESIVLGAFIGSDLVSTMRIEMIEDQTLLERKLECPWDFPRTISFPVMLLSKASTDSGFRNTGMNALLRKFSFELAKEWKTSLVLGTFIAGSPRVNSMGEMGYQFYENKKGWNQVNYRSFGTVLVACLDVSRNIDQALAVTTQLTTMCVNEFPWEGQRPLYKVVRNIS